MSESAHEKGTILVVEDNDFVRMQIVTYLQSGGYAVREAKEADGGIEVLKNDDISMALVDVRMEPKGGFSFVKMAISDGYDIPTAFVTGDESADILAQAGKLGVQVVLMKPVEKDRLLKTVERTIAMHKRHR